AGHERHAPRRPGRRARRLSARRQGAGGVRAQRRVPHRRGRAQRSVFLISRSFMEVPPMAIADFSLAGKVAIVTGGSRGIGRSIAIALAEHGADVAIAARKPEALAEATAAVSETGRRAIAVPTNVRRIDELRALVDQTQSQLGRVDILVNNAGTNPVYGPIQEVTSARSTRSWTRT